MIRIENRDAAIGTVTVEEWDQATGYIRTVNGDVVEQRALTAAEASMVAAYDKERTEQANRETVDSRLVTVDLPAMQAIIDQTNADLRTDPSQEIKDIARAVRRLTRIVEGVLDGVD